MSGRKWLRTLVGLFFGSLQGPEERVDAIDFHVGIQLVDVVLPVSGGQAHLQAVGFVDSVFRLVLWY